MANNSVLKKSENFVIIAGLLLLSILLGMYIASQRVSAYETAARVQVAQQTAVLNTIAETIARNGADSVTEAIIKDCAVDDRVRFDNLLGRLDEGLTTAQLTELDSLFGSCASFASDRKALMAARFARELAAYQSQVALLDTLTSTDEVEEAQVSSWAALVAQEQIQSDLFAQLVTAQKQIIDQLIAGKSASAEEIVTILAAVNETREAIVFSRQQAKQIRGTVTSL